MSEDSPHRPVVTLAALYGAGGSVGGPRVAERLDIPFLDREIPDAVVKETGLSKDAVQRETIGHIRQCGGLGTAQQRNRLR